MTEVVDGIHAGAGWCVYGWLCTALDVDSDEIILGLDNRIEKSFSDIYFEVCSYGNIEGLVTGVVYGFNSGAGWCITFFRHMFLWIHIWNNT